MNAAYLAGILLTAALFVGVGSATAYAEDLAVCGGVSGKAYFLEKGIVTKKNSGWNDDRISGGRTTLVKLADNGYDVLFVDSLGAVVSTVQKGAKVIKMRQGASDMTFLVYYPGNTIEIYTFFMSNTDQPQMMLLQSKGGDSALIHKGAIFIGRCDFIKFD